MGITNGYCTLAQLKSSIQDKQSYSKNDSYFEDVIERVSRYIDKKTGKFFYSKTLTDSRVDVNSKGDIYISYEGSRLLSKVPIISVSSIKNDGTTLTASTDYRVYDDFVQKDGTWSTGWTGTDGVLISGVIGYAETPEDIELLCIELCKVISGMNERLSFDENGGSRIDINNNIPNWIKHELRQWSYKNV